MEVLHGHSLRSALDKLVEVRFAHLLEVETGFRSGDPLRAGSGEPRPEFDPDHARLLALDKVGYRTLAGLEEVLREYLSPEHRDNPAAGCPSAALLDEIGRCATATKSAYTDGAWTIVDGIAAHLAPDDPRSARGKALGLFTLAVGTLQLSRAMADPELALNTPRVLLGVWPVAAGGTAATFGSTA